MKSLKVSRMGDARRDVFGGMEVIYAVDGCPHPDELPNFDLQLSIIPRIRAEELPALPCNAELDPRIGRELHFHIKNAKGEWQAPFDQWVTKLVELAVADAEAYAARSGS
jgi:hypothetical protein